MSEERKKKENSWIVDLFFRVYNDNKRKRYAKENQKIQGHPVVLSLRPGDFTTEGHFIVLVEKQDGGYVVRDPNSRVRSQKLWDYGTLEPQIKNLWEFQRIS